MSTSFFQGANNIHIEGSQFYVNTEVPIQYGRGGGRPLDILDEHCALEALLDSKERFPPPRCDEQTREVVIQTIMDWITSDDESASMMVLRGSAGLGKSALEQSVAEKCRKHGLYAAGFFFSTTSSNRNNGDTLIPTLVRQLMQVIPGLRELVEKELENDPHLFKLSREAQMERLLVKHIQITAPPISPTTPKPSRIKRIFSRQKPRTSSTQAPSMDSRSTRQPRLVAIDGFDECNDQTIQHDLLLILASALTRLHYPFRFLIATRPESHIVQILQHHPSFQCGAVLHVNLNDTNADDDIL